MQSNSNWEWPISFLFSKFCSVQKQYEQAKDEATKASQETERLLQVVQMTQEEQNAKEKTIMDLQQWVEWSMVFESREIR